MAKTASKRPSKKAEPKNSIAFQGLPGAYSDLACREVYPKLATLPTETFEETFAALEKGRVGLAMIPIENSVAGRVADIHQLIPHATKLHIVGEHFQRVEHCLLAPEGATLQSIKVVRSHIHALSQCRNFIRKMGLKAVVHADTAGAAAELAERNDPTEAAIASTLAAKIYGLKILKTNIEDAAHNTTRFIVLSRAPVDPGPKNGPVMTSFLFQVRNIPAALYKAMGGFATNGVNMTKLESYIRAGSFDVSMFYADVEGHPSEPAVKLAMEELSFFSDELRIMGVYPAHAFRYKAKARR
ncbi:MAG TPA: prephenate dehydratase [Alphaproteobacteria bacterium]|jgi:prephenate dehydratase